MKRNIGGDRLGSGNKMNVELHGYERSTHDMGCIKRTTLSPGTLIPIYYKMGLPGDTWDINIDALMNTHPTLGPVFGSMKMQFDVFWADLRLYNGKLHNNKLKVGMDISVIKFPQIQLLAQGVPDTVNPNTAQVNPSCILAYLGIRGIGNIGNDPDLSEPRQFNAVPLLMYWDIYKNYYSNKQEEIGAVIHNPVPVIHKTVNVGGVHLDANTIPQTTPGGMIPASTSSVLSIAYTGTAPTPNTIMLTTNLGRIAANLIFTELTTAPTWTGLIKWDKYPNLLISAWDYLQPGEQTQTQPTVEQFELGALDTIRELILDNTSSAAAFVIDNASPEPFSFLCDAGGGQSTLTSTQEGLGLKTYQSDMFNNWIDTEWIDGAGGITELTKVSTAGDEFTLDALVLAKKMYDMLNRIAISGGTYYDWMEVQYDQEIYAQAETPIYCGGLSKEIVFQEVISNSQSTSDTDGVQPLGTLAGKGTFGQKHKGGKVTIKCNQVGYIMIMASITPRIDYSQGNQWDTHLTNLEEVHVPALDQIGFEDLNQEQQAWWTTEWDNVGNKWVNKSTGKQPAWMNYMTAYNENYGNFAIEENEMFMTFNRRYEKNVGDIADNTTYIDPTKYNYIFAQTSLDAQNFWLQVAIDATARRKMSAKIMPNL